VPLSQKCWRGQHIVKMINAPRMLIVSWHSGHSSSICRRISLSPDEIWSVKAQSNGYWHSVPYLWSGDWETRECYIWWHQSVHWGCLFKSATSQRLTHDYTVLCASLITCYYPLLNTFPQCHRTAAPKLQKHWLIRKLSLEIRLR